MAPADGAEITGGEESGPEPADTSAQRRQKVESLRRAGVEPYALGFDRTHSTSAARALFVDAHGTEEVADSAKTAPVRIAGRLTAIRIHGKAGFATISDQAGSIQVYCRVDVLGEEAYAMFLDLDYGDIVGVEGPVFRTRRGEVTVEAQRVTLLTKSLRQMPEKWHGLRDPELRHRHRYLDMIANPWVREVLTARAAVVRGIRNELEDRGFIEIETPVLQPIYGGALARPFVTHYNVLDHDFYLRIATELYLKRLLVGGFERIYEIGRCFRNEGMSTRHNPEYTMLEVYQAFAGLDEMLELTETMVRRVAAAMPAGLRPSYQGRELDLETPWARRPMVDLVREHTGIDPLAVTDGPALAREARSRGVEVGDDTPWGVTVNELFEKLVEAHLWEPTFVTDHPIDTSPLARRRPDDPRFALRFELWIAGRELANAFGELTDPIDQRERLERQAAERAAGAAEAHPMDEDFVSAIEYGMPPSGGLGVGIDRLVMILTDQASIREVVAFPQLRPRD